MKLKSKGWRRAAVAGLGLTLSVASACNKKSSGGDDTASTEAEKVNDVSGAVLANTLALQLDDTINVIPSKSSDGATLALSALDDAKASVNYRISEESLKSLDQVQGIFCFLAATKYAEMANKGAYVALVDENKCFKNNGGDGQSQSVTRVTVLSEREEGKAIVVKLWFPASDGDNGMQVRLIVAEGSSDKNPLGIFRLDFGKGYMESKRAEDGSLSLVFNEADNRPEEQEARASKLAVLLGVDETTGEINSGRMVTESSESYQQGSRSSAFTVAFNNDLHNRSGTTDGKEASACLDRNSYSSSANQYSLYNGDGSEVKLSSGFPIEYTKDGKTGYGYASYWGVNGQGGQGFADNQVVNKVDYSTGSPALTPYTVKSAPGKLMKKVKKTVTLADLKGTELKMYTEGSSLVVKWDGTNFTKVALVNYTNDGEQRTPQSGNATPAWSGDFFNFQVDSLGGMISVKAADANDATIVPYFQQTLVSGTDQVPTGELVCFERCIVAAPSAASFQQPMGSIASAAYVIFGEGAQARNSAGNLASPLGVYTWDSAIHNLKVNGTAFVLPSFGASLAEGEGEGESGGKQSYFLNSGILLPRTVYDALTDEQKNSSPYELDRMITEFYEFSTGSESHSKFTALIGADGNLVQFDQPINLSYVHSRANDLNGAATSEFYGQTFSLQYGGRGNLYGLPYDQSSGGDNGGFTPKFSLNVGATLADGRFLVPSQVQQMLQPAADPAACAGLPLDVMPDMPTEAPAPIDNGEAPDEATTPVRVSFGEITAA